MNRRRFAATLAAIGFIRAGKLFAEPEDGSAVRENAEAETIQLSRNGWVPNNEDLPVLLYREAIVPGHRRSTDTFEAAFQRNGWPPEWRSGIYDFHHYHSTAHEVLGFAAGWGKLMLGGEAGQVVTVHAGDVAVLPTGTGHREIEASPDFLVVGAYPPNQEWDLCRSAPSPEAIARMRRLHFPAWDPVTGKNGSLPRLWRYS